MSGDLMPFVGREAMLYTPGRPASPIRIDGVSTATDAAQQEYDISYTSDCVLPEQFTDETILTDSTSGEGLRPTQPSEIPDP